MIDLLIFLYNNGDNEKKMRKRLLEKKTKEKFKINMPTLVLGVDYT